MIDHEQSRRLSAGSTRNLFGAFAFAVMAGFVARGGGVLAAPAPHATPTPHPAKGQGIPTPQAVRQPTPFPVVTLGPASEATSLPYPAYGSPVPGVGVGPVPTSAPPVVTLPQAIAIGFARNPILVSARADEGLAHAAKRLAQTGYYPSLSGTTATTRSNRQPGSLNVSNGTTGTTTGTTGTTSTSSSTTTNLTANLRQLIFDGGRVAAAIRSASFSETAAVDTYQRQLQNVAFNVATAYYNQLQAQRTTAVAIQTVRLDLVQEDLVRAQIRAGTAAPVDLSTTQLPTAQARLAVVRAQAAELNAQATFANTMGLDANTDILPFDDTPVTATGAISTISVPGYDQALARAYALRPDLDASTRQVQASEESLRQARLGLFPTLSGTASAGTGSQNSVGGDFRNNNTLGVSLSIPLFDQGITAAQTLQARANLERTSAQLEIARQALQLNVKQSLINLVSARAALDQAQAEFTKATDVLRATQAQYRAGVTTLPLLLNAQVGLTQALTDQVTAVYALRQAEQAYLYAIGANTP